MNKLPSDFRLYRYGIDVRLVTEEDADFIFELRSNKMLTRHIHAIDDDVNKQIQWIREYKKRENEGREYYFIYSKNGCPFGVNRVSNIYEYYGLGGSWICSPGTDVSLSMATPFVEHDISFDIIGLDYLVFDVRKANTHVWKFHESTGAVRIGESPLDYYYYLYKDNYNRRKIKFLKILNII